MKKQRKNGYWLYFGSKNSCFFKNYCKFDEISGQNASACSKKAPICVPYNRMGRSDATREEMMEALRVADALDFVNELPQGLDTVIGEKATGISEGQAQRISIARALLKKSGFLILDEATSALDENTEKKILEAIAGTEHPTCLFVSHRRYLERYADQVVELERSTK